MNNEEEIIARMLAKNKALTTNNKIKSGVTEDGELKDLQAAIQRGASSCCSLLHDWNSENAKIVGHVVRVYWDGEKEWFSGTIVNYDYRTGKHYVYYDLDSTAEWVDLKTEPSIVTADICLAKFGAQIWPAYTHIISDSGKCILKHSKTSGEYIEFIDETRSNGYVSKNNIFPYKPPTSLITSDMTEFFDASVDPISHTKSTKPLKRSSLSPKMLHSHKIALAEMAELKKTIGVRNG